ncbi:MAG: hypothetical protein PHH26_02835 [Candidatus Thermoplasmatota archaeon]|nr:hypothetical protein [Candidatus Thermoplasmatota archaeon]
MLLSCIQMITGCFYLDADMDSSDRTMTISSLKIGDFARYKLEGAESGFLSVSVSDYSNSKDGFGTEHRCVVIETKDENPNTSKATQIKTHVDINSREIVQIELQADGYKKTLYNVYGLSYFSAYFESDFPGRDRIILPFVVPICIQREEIKTVINTTIKINGVSVVVDASKSLNINEVSVEIEYGWHSGSINLLDGYSMDGLSLFPKNVSFSKNIDDKSFTCTRIECSSGNTPIVWAICKSKHETQLSPNGEYLSPDRGIPKDGSNCDFGFKLSEAVSAIQSSEKFMEYQSEHPNSGLTRAYHSKDSFSESWDIFYGNPSMEGYSSNVKKYPILGPIISNEENINEIRPENIQFETALTVGGALNIVNNEYNNTFDTFAWFLIDSPTGAPALTMIYYVGWNGGLDSIVSISGLNGQIIQWERI